MEPITFGELRKYCCVFDRVSVCMQETGRYDNYRLIAHAPSTYDQYYLYGFGMFESEFVDDDFEGWDRPAPPSLHPPLAKRGDGAFNHAWKSCSPKYRERICDIILLWKGGKRI